VNTGEKRGGGLRKRHIPAIGEAEEGGLRGAIRLQLVRQTGEKQGVGWVAGLGWMTASS
jgi:hypothetical protein